MVFFIILNLAQWSWNWTKKKVIPIVVLLSYTPPGLGTCLLYWSFGEQEIWAPAMLSCLLISNFIRTLMNPLPEETRAYVPRRHRWRTKRDNLRRRAMHWIAVSGIPPYRFNSVPTFLLGLPLCRKVGQVITSWWYKPATRKKVKATADGSGKSGRRIQRLRLSRSSHRLRLSRHYGFPKAAKRRTRPDKSANKKSCTSHEWDDPIDVFYEADQGKIEDLPKMIALAAPESSRLSGSTDHRYDADSFLIAVDNCCSQSITNCMDDYIKPQTKVIIMVRGIGGYVAATMKGTVKWKIEDDKGQVHTMLIPDTYYHADSPYRLLSPQHWSQSKKRPLSKETRNMVRHF
jgi:hypothetical protein